MIEKSERARLMEKIEAKIEAILFTVGDSIHIDKLSKAVGHDKGTIKKIILNMIDKYEADDRGIKIIELEDSYQLCSKKEYYDVIREIMVKEREDKLTDVLIETLSIIAYKQPITRAHIEEIRGVNSNHSVNKLVEYGLIHEVGRLEAPGKPILFGTTKDFLRGFGIGSLHELPSINDEQATLIKGEALKEIQLKLDE